MCNSGYLTMILLSHALRHVKTHFWQVICTCPNFNINVLQENAFCRFIKDHNKKHKLIWCLKYTGQPLKMAVYFTFTYLISYKIYMYFPQMRAGGYDVPKAYNSTEEFSNMRKNRLKTLLISSLETKHVPTKGQF
jgi:hypothetical protein